MGLLELKIQRDIRLHVQLLSEQKILQQFNSIKARIQIDII